MKVAIVTGVAGGIGKASALALAKKGYTAENIDIDALINLHLDINKLKTSTQNKLEEKNRLSNSIKSASPEERPQIIAQSKSLGEEIKTSQEELAKLQEQFDNVMWRMPNLPSDQSPVAEDEEGNVVIKKVGEPTKFNFTPLDHIELMEKNNEYITVSKLKTQCENFKNIIEKE
mgnify:CR=1 FL=1